MWTNLRETFTSDDYAWEYSTAGVSAKNLRLRRKGPAIPITSTLSLIDLKVSSLKIQYIRNIDLEDVDVDVVFRQVQSQDKKGWDESHVSNVSKEEEIQQIIQRARSGSNRGRTSNVLIDFLLYFTNARIRNLKIRLNEILNIHISELKISNNGAQFSEFFMYLGEKMIFSSTVGFEVKFDFMNFDVRVTNVLELVIDININEIPKLLTLISSSKVVDGSIQHFRKLSRIRQLRKGFFTSKLREHCLRFFMYKSCFEIIRDYDSTEVSPLGFDDVPEIEKNDLVTTYVDDEGTYINFWDVKNTMSKLEDNLHPEAIAEFRYYIENKAPLPEQKGGISFHYQANVKFSSDAGCDLSCELNEKGLKNIYMNICSGKKHLAEVNVLCVQIDRPNKILFDQISLTSDAPTPISKIDSLQFDYRSRYLFVNKEVNMHLPLPLIVSLVNHAIDLNNKYSTLNDCGSLRTRPQSITRKSPVHNKFNIRLFRISLEIPQLGSIDLNNFHRSGSDITCKSFQISELATIRNMTLKEKKLRCDVIEVNYDRDNIQSRFDMFRALFLEKLINRTFPSRQPSISSRQSTPFKVVVEKSISISCTAKLNKICLLQSGSADLSFNSFSQDDCAIYHQLSFTNFVVEGSPDRATFYRHTCVANQIKFVYSTYSENSGPEKPSASLAVTANAGCQVVYLHSTIQLMLNFYNEITTPLPIKYPKQHKCTKLSFEIDAVELILPVSHTSPHYFCVAASKLSLQNHFECVLNQNFRVPIVYNCINVILNDVHFGTQVEQESGSVEGLNAFQLNIRYWLGGDVRYYHHHIHSDPTEANDSSTRMKLAAMLNPKWEVRLSNFENEPRVHLRLTRRLWHYFKTSIDFNIGETRSQREITSATLVEVEEPPTHEGCLTTWKFGVCFQVLSLELDHGKYIQFRDFKYEIFKHAPLYHTVQSLKGYMCLPPYLSSYIVFKSESDNISRLYHKSVTCDIPLFAYPFRETSSNQSTYAAAADVIEDQTLTKLLLLLRDDYLYYFTDSEPIPMMVLKEEVARSDWMQTDNLRWYCTRHGIFDSEHGGNVMDAIRSSWPKNVKWTFEVCANDSYILQCDDVTNFKDPLKSRSNLNIICRADIVFEYQILNDFDRIKILNVDNCLLLGNSELHFDFIMNNDVSTVNIPSMTLHDLPEVAALLTGFDLPPSLYVYFSRLDIFGLNFGFGGSSGDSVKAKHCEVHSPSGFVVVINDVNGNKDEKDVNFSRAEILLSNNGQRCIEVDDVSIRFLAEHACRININSILINYEHLLDFALFSFDNKIDGGQNASGTKKVGSLFNFTALNVSIIVPERKVPINLKTFICRQTNEEIILSLGDFVNVKWRASQVLAVKLKASTFNIDLDYIFGVFVYRTLNKVSEVLEDRLFAEKPNGTLDVETESKVPASINLDLEPLDLKFGPFFSLGTGVARFSYQRSGRPLGRNISFHMEKSTFRAGRMLNINVSDVSFHQQRDRHHMLWKLKTLVIFLDNGQEHEDEFFEVTSRIYQKYLTCIAMIPQRENLPQQNKNLCEAKSSTPISINIDQVKIYPNPRFEIKCKGISSKLSDKNVNANIAHINFYLISRDLSASDSSSYFQLFSRPLDIQVNYSKNSNVLDFDVSKNESIKWNLNFEDLKLSYTIMKCIEQDVKSLILSMSLLYKSKQCEEFKEVVSDNVEDELQRKQSKIALNSSGLHINLHEKFCGGPLLRFEINRIYIQYFRSTRLSSRLEFSPTILYHNPRNATFEPLLEPSKFVVEMMKSNNKCDLVLSYGTKNLQGVENSNVVSSVRVNLADPAVEILARSIRQGKDTFKDAYFLQNLSWDSVINQCSSMRHDRNQTAMTKVVLRNQTGLKVKVNGKRLGHSMKKSLAKLPVVHEEEETDAMQDDGERIDSVAYTSTIMGANDVEVGLQASTDTTFSIFLQGAGEAIKNVDCFVVGKFVLFNTFKSRVLATNDYEKISVPVQCQIERIPMRSITLSSTILIETLGRGQVECGAQVLQSNSMEYTHIESFGETPVHLPLKYLLSLGSEDQLEISIRPMSEVEEYKWSECVLRYSSSAKLRNSRASTPTKHETFFSWELINSRVFCPSVGNDKDVAFMYVTAEFDSYCSTTVSAKISPSLSIRNLLPMQLTWQTSFRPNQYILQPGECSDICESSILPLSQDSETNQLLRIGMRSMWSSWMELKFEENKGGTNDDGTEDASCPRGLRPKISTRTLTTIIQLENNSPLCVGLKIVPKFLTTMNSSMEVVVFAELWIKNLTGLDLNIGFPRIVDRSNTLAAEAALQELTSVLEGRTLNDQYGSRNICSIPIQSSNLVFDEIFEYVEVQQNYGQAKLVRRWYATDHHEVETKNPADYDLPQGWRWDSPWKVDMLGANIADGGWESAHYLDSWKSLRIFSPRENFRRRRWYRSRRKISYDSDLNVIVHHGNKVEGESTCIAIKVQDGTWSRCFNCSENGVVRVRSSRWPALSTKDESQTHFVSDLSYIVSPIGGSWGTATGEYANTNILCLTARFILRNESTRYAMEVKQQGIIGKENIMVLKPGESAPFWWSNVDSSHYHAAELICVRPTHTTHITENAIASSLSSEAENTSDRSIFYKWSGGFDPCNLGTTALRIRLDSKKHEQNISGFNIIRTIRANVSIRPRSYNTGINISLKEEQPDGTGSLFRIENRTTFPLWIAQEGLMANPASLLSYDPNADTTDDLVSQINTEMAGDCIRPGTSISFGLDDPSRQVKHGKGNLFLRVALAPLRTRDGLETTKLIKLEVGDKVTRLNPSELSSTLDDITCDDLQIIRVAGVIVSDGPSRVARFCLIKKDVSATRALSNAAKRQAKRSESYLNEAIGIDRSILGFRSIVEDKLDKETQIRKLISMGALAAIELSKSNDIPSQEQAVAAAQQGTGIFSLQVSTINDLLQDTNYNVRVFIDEFSVSLIDQEPSEIAAITFRSISCLFKWNTSRSEDTKVTLSIGWFQIDNFIPNAPFGVALVPMLDSDLVSGFSLLYFIRENTKSQLPLVQLEDIEPSSESQNRRSRFENCEELPFLAVNVALAPKHISGVTCIKLITIVPSNLAIGVDLAFIVRLQRYFLGALDRVDQVNEEDEIAFRTSNSNTWLYAESQRYWPLPNMQKLFDARQNEVKGDSEIYIERMTVFPYSLSLSVAPSRALSNAQAQNEGPGAAAIHAAVRKGDLSLSTSTVLGVKIGRTNRTAMAVARGIFKSIVVDALLRCEEASLALPGISIQNYLSTSTQVTTYMMAHYLSALKSNVPQLIGSLAVFGNPLGLIRGLGDGVSDFVSEPIKGLQKSLEELDPTFVFDGVARGTGSLARATVGSVADSASLLTQTLSKNMAVLTLDRKYAQRRDRTSLRESSDGSAPTLMDGLGSGSAKLIKGVYDGVSGVVSAPLRGAEKAGAEGFAKGVGKGLLGLVVKPVVGLSDAATDIMIGVKGSVEGGTYNVIGKKVESMKRANHLRNRRAFYGKQRMMKGFNQQDAAAAQLMMTTRLAGEQFLSFVDMGNAGVLLLSVRRFVVITPDVNTPFGKESICVKYKNISKMDVRRVPTPDESLQWGVVVLLRSPRGDGSEVEVITCQHEEVAYEIHSKVVAACKEKSLTTKKLSSKSKK